MTRLAHSLDGKLTLAVLAVAAIFLLPSARCLAYALEGETWPDGQIKMQLQLATPPIPLGDGRASFNDSARDALNTWNLYLQRVQFTATDAPAGFIPQADDGVNSVATASTIFGQTFGATTLAVTLIDKDGSTLLGTDTLVNNRFNFDSYTGPLRRTSTGTVEDLHRVLLHEFGHVLGLDHPDQAGQNVAAIMNSRISDLDHLSDDDIAGAHYLYDLKTTNPPIEGNSPGKFARIAAGKIQIDKIVYSAATGNIYAIGKKKGLGDERLVTYDPYTLQVLASPDLPEPPDNLAISGDGRYLYLTYSASGQERVRRLDLFSGVEDENFALFAPAPVGTNTNIRVRDLQVSPGESDVLAVSEEYSISSIIPIPPVVGSAVVLYDHGRPRVNTVVYQEVLAPQLQFGGDSTQLFATPIGIDNFVHRLAVDPAGVVELSRFSTQIFSSPATPYIPGFVYNNGYLYDDAATRFDVGIGNPKQIGGLEFADFILAVDSVTSRIFYLGTGFNHQIFAYSLPDGKALGVVPVPTVTSTLEKASFLAWGQRGLAFGSPDLRGLYVARSVNFGDDAAGGGSPDTLTLQGPAVATISQNSGQTLKFRVRRDTSAGDSSQALTVRYTVRGTGVNGVNFRTLTGTVKLPANRSQVKIKLVPQPDSLNGGTPATVTLSLAADPSYRVAAPATATVAITPQ